MLSAAPTWASSKSQADDPDYTNDRLLSETLYMLDYA